MVGRSKLSHVQTFMNQGLHWLSEKLTLLLGDFGPTGCTMTSIEEPSDCKKLGVFFLTIESRVDHSSPKHARMFLLEVRIDG